MNYPSQEQPKRNKNLLLVATLAATTALTASCTSQPEYRAADPFTSIGVETGGQFFAESDLTGTVITIDTQKFPATDACTPGINSPFPEAIKSGVLEVKKPNQQYDIDAYRAIYTKLPLSQQGYVHPGEVYGLEADRLAVCTEDPAVLTALANDEDNIIWFKESKDNSPIAVYGYPKG